MKQMIRRQIYISKGQAKRLKLVAEIRGLSEAELISLALEHELKRVDYRHDYDGAAMKRLNQTIHDQDKKPPVPQRKRDWKREDLYEDRMKRYEH